MKSDVQDDLQPASHGQRAIAAAAVTLALVALFAPVLLSDRLFAMRDAGHYYYPLFKWCADEWAGGRAPLWNPHENGGTAVCADPTASLWYPGKLVFALPLEFSLRFKLYIVGHVVLCAAAAWWLARRWGASVYGSALAALCYSCGGSVVFGHCNVVYLVGAAWLPIAAGLLDDLLRRGRWPAAGWLGAVLALMILGGDPQMAYHVLLAGGLYAIVLASGSRQPADDVAHSSAMALRITLASLPANLGLLAATALIALLLAAVQILPSAEATASSERVRHALPRSLYESAAELGAGTGDVAKCARGLFAPPVAGTHHAAAYEFSIGPWRLAELVWPNCGGRMFPEHRRWLSLLAADERIWTPSLYLGLVPLLLGLSALNLRAADARIRWLSWMALIFTLGSFGTYGLGWLARQAFVACGGSSAGFPLGDAVGGVYWLFLVLLPKYVLFRYPAKLLVVASLAVAILAAGAWDRACARRPSRLLRVLWVLGIASGLAAGVALVVSQFVVLGAGNIDAAFGPLNNRGAWRDIVGSLVHASLVSLAAAWLFRMPPEAPRSTSSLWQAALLLLCAGEMSLANHWLIPSAPASLWREPSAVATAIEQASGDSRIYRAARWWPPEFAAHGSAQRMEDIVRWERQTLAQRYSLLDTVPMVNTAPRPIAAAQYEAMLDAVDPRGTGKLEPSALRRSGAGLLILPAHVQPEFAERIPQSGLPRGAALWRMKQSPRSNAEPAEHRFDLRAFQRGAIVSTASWIVLIGVASAHWLRRRARRLKSSSSTPA